MTITSARVRELSEAAFERDGGAAAFDRIIDMFANHAAHIAKALDLYERVQAGDAATARAVARAMRPMLFTDTRGDISGISDAADEALCTLAALVGEG